MFLSINEFLRIYNKLERSNLTLKNLKRCKRAMRLYQAAKIIIRNLRRNENERNNQ